MLVALFRKPRKAGGVIKIATSMVVAEGIQKNLAPRGIVHY